MAVLAILSGFAASPSNNQAARRGRGSVRCRACAALSGPPPSFDHRAATAEAGAALALAHPSLAPLLRDGLLLALPRPARYAERRADGYEAPRCVWLLGTAHLSQRSAGDVSACVEALRPDAVVVELCRSRAGVMYAPPPGDASAAGATSLSLSGGEPLPAALLRSVRLGGGGALLLRALLGAAASRAAGGAALGAEFAAAARAAEATSATLVLGDRPVEVTLRRAMQAATPAERLRAARLLLPLALRAAPPALDGAAMDALLRDEDAVSALFARFAADFPSLAAPLVHERDAYLAWSCCRSKAVSGKSGVLAVVGAGHLRGVTWALINADGGAGLRFGDLVGRSEAKKQEQPLWRRLAVDAAIAAAAAAAWAALHPGAQDAAL